MTFRNLDEVRQYYQKQLDTGNTKALNDIKTGSGRGYGSVTDEILIAEADRLRDCIQKRINEFYDMPRPKPPQYQRTNGLRRALQAETMVSVEKGRKYIGLYFEDSISWGRSKVTGEWNGYKPWLMDRGYKDTSFRTPHFQGYAGFNFIEKGIEDWKSKLKYPIDVKRIGAQGKFDFAERIGYSFG